MDRRTRHRRRAGALWLLVLAFVSVLAPVWADSYLCPMAKKALAETKSCCAKTEAAHLASVPGAPRVEPPCDCPKLSWSADAADHVRELRTGSEQTIAIVADIPRLRVVLSTFSVTSSPESDRSARASAPPLWRLHQSILC